MLRYHRLPSHQQRQGTHHPSDQHALPAHQWAEKLEYLSLALWPLCRLSGMVAPARGGTSPPPSPFVPGKSCCLASGAAKNTPMSPGSNSIAIVFSSILSNTLVR